MIREEIRRSIANGDGENGILSVPIVFLYSRKGISISCKRETI